MTMAMVCTQDRPRQQTESWGLGFAIAGGVFLSLFILLGATNCGGNFDNDNRPIHPLIYQHRN